MPDGLLLPKELLIMSYDYWIVNVDQRYHFLYEIAEESELRPLGNKEDIQRKISDIFPEIEWTQKDDDGTPVVWGALSSECPSISILINGDADVCIVNVLTSSRQNLENKVHAIAMAIKGSAVDMQTQEIWHSQTSD